MKEESSHVPHVLHFNENGLGRKDNAELKINGDFYVAFRLPEEKEKNFPLQAPNLCSLVWLLAQIAAQDFEEVEITTFICSIFSCFIVDKITRKQSFTEV